MIRNIIKNKMDSFNSKISDNLDLNFSVVSEHIRSMDEFNERIMDDFKRNKQLFYRGERLNDPHRQLLPTMLRNTNEKLFGSDMGIIHIDAPFLLDYYVSMGDFVNVFQNTMGIVDKNHLYEISAFAQHYCDFSPLIDFTKSIYPALSFAIKDRDNVEDDIVLYVLELKDSGDYTDDINVANQWLKDLSVYTYNINEKSVKVAVKDMIGANPLTAASDELRAHLERITSMPSPKAKLIDVPVNTRMKFQQGVFLLLTDFQFFKNTYFTKNIREQFLITKYIIDKDICAELKNMVLTDTPWYAYKYLTDVESAFKSAINNSQS